MPSTATRLATPQETRDFGYRRGNGENCVFYSSKLHAQSCLDHIPHTSLADSHSQMACVTLPTCHWQIGQAGWSWRDRNIKNAEQ
ncbi:uncharacterized protein LOC122299668 isoform X3 [Carya illinoinensis]|uniref:uncharacterized protein LOC122299668 isoform X3 n=1 Tax=Carya illinoinensis TaxID=32201 RepID=UPI001C71DC5C|nr:uncharacterized protein LOC122299668 isoform X3 [Carya illinoinensis]